MSDAATPVEQKGGTPPAAPAATPAPNSPETVTLSKEAHDQLQKDAARASANQRKADLYDKTHGKKGHFKPTAPATPPSQEEVQAAAAEEDRKAERGLLRLASDPALREVLDADPTLRDLMTNNPLALLPTLAPDALDAEDAISLVKESLMARKKPATPPAPPAPSTPPASDNAPKPGVINTPSSGDRNEEVEAARKLPNTEKAVQGMISARLRQAAGKK